VSAIGRRRIGAIGTAVGLVLGTRPADRPPAAPSFKVVIEVLKPEQIAHFRKKLIDEQRAIESRITATQGDIMDTVRDEEGASDDEYEAQRIYDREDGIVSNELDAQQLAQVKKALARIDAGTYGVSEVSGKPIPIARLEAVPSATTLVTEEPA
jgi:RNA polymerase-binding transcription factor DksA